MDPSGLAGAEVVANAAAAHHGPSERKGPVEFNHAISYVNKIKTRFHDNPETYKQFLEILQTYQREQKPIQDVYDQVTTLFHSAPDLLEDFKQFLPEHAAAQPKTTPSRLTEEPMGLPPPSHTPQPALRGDTTKMPPIGSFAPPSATKETKKRPRVEKQIQPVPNTNDVPTSAMRSTAGPFTNGNKKAKLHHRGAAGADDASMMEPTLTPVLSEPFPPPSPIVNSRKELQFFEKVKKALGRQKINDFLKLCNLYNQNIIDRTSLYERGAAFLTGSPDLLLAWKTLLCLDTQVTNVTSRPAPPSDKVSLSNCRGYGPSYRLLPQRERLRPCSGRDELCNSVLNDEWASHPTWASEDSGFVAHRKNQFEEGLHRVEEERHDYDFNIEANVKCIQLLEPIAQQMLIMTPAERETFSMTEALAGQTVSIFKRVAKKLYGEKGISVINDMWGHPFEVVPILLARMKQKDEDWRFSQREWNKVWHQQSDNMHLRSLDHMGIHVKINDKRNMSAKHLVDVIKTRAEDQRREREEKAPHDENGSVGSGKPHSGGAVDAHQFTWDFDDKELIADLIRLVLIFNYQNGQHSSGEKSRVHAFFLEFVAPYFDMSDEMVSKRMPDFSDESGDDDGDEPLLAISGRGGKKTGKRGDLRRGVLDRLGAGSGSGAGGRARDHKEDSAASGSKETTPEGTSANEEDMPDIPDDSTTGASADKHWLGVAPEAFVLDPDLVKNPQAAAALAEALSTVTGRPKPDSLFTRQFLNFFCNQTIFVFFSVVQALYQRMKEVKDSTDSVLKAIERQSYDKPARFIGLADNVMDFFKVTDTPTEFWPRTMELLEEFLEGEREESSFHEVLRFYYMKCGWKLYTVQELIKTLCRLSLVCTSPDPKEKTSALINMYMNSRHVDQTSFQAELTARKDAEKCIKEGEMFVITWNPAKAEAKVRWLQKDDPTFNEPLKDVTERWQYYISSYMRIEPTEGVPRRRLQKSVLARNLPGPESELDPSSLSDNVSTCQELGSSICVLSFKMLWKPNTSEYFVCDNAPKTEEGRAERTELQERMTLHRERQAHSKFVRKSSWMTGMSQDVVQQAKSKFRNWVTDGAAPLGEEDADVEMAA
jgi:paired amphipathic helix protein Sin3a